MKIIKSSLIFVIIFMALFGSVAVPVVAQAKNLTILGIDLGCDPELPPKSGGCGLTHFIILINGAIRFLLTSVVLPVGLLMIVWAGFVIITAGGSKERVAKGKKIITTAIIGIVIAVLAAAAVAAIYSLIIGSSFNLF